MQSKGYCLDLGTFTRENTEKRVLFYANKKGPYDVYFEIPDKQDGRIQIPIAKGIPAKDRQGHSPVVASHQLVQLCCRWWVTPKVLSEALHDPEQILRLPGWLRQQVYAYGTGDNWFSRLPGSLQTLVNSAFLPENNPPLRDGWLYLFKDHYLWREIEVKGGLYQEVDLTRHFAKDIRPSTGIAATDILFVHMANDRTVGNQLIFSEVQWSWPRINYYGGMDSDDFRVKDRDFLSDFSRSDCIARQQQRLAAVDLDGLIHDNMDDSWLIGNTGHPVLLLQDPLGIAQRWQLDLVDNFLALQGCVSTISKKNYFHLAVLTYHFFFNKNIHSNEYIDSSSPVGFTPPLFSQHIIQASRTNAIFEAALKLDKDKIEQLLEVKPRKEKRELIWFFQENLFKLVNDEMFVQSLEDYFSGNPADYENGFLKISGFLTLLNADPRSIDYCLDLVEEKIGSKKLNVLNDPLYKKIFPNIEGHDFSIPTESRAVDVCEDKNKGDGEFREELFACLYQNAVNKNPLISVNGSMVEVDNRLTIAVDGILTYLLKTDPCDETMKLAVGIIDATGAFSGIFLSQVIDPTSVDHYIFGFGTALGGAQELKSVSQGTVPIYEKEHIRGYASPVTNAGVAAKAVESTNPFKSLLKSKLMFQLRLEDNSSVKFTSEKDLLHHLAGKGTASVQGLLAVFNLVLVIKEAFSDERSWPKNIYEFSSATTNMLVTMKDVSEIVLGSEYVTAFFSEKKIASYFLSNEVKILGLLETRANYLLSSFSIIGILLSIRSVYHDLYNDQPNQLLGSSIMLLGNSMVVGTQIGKALMNQFKHELEGIYSSEALTKKTRVKIIETLFLEMSDIDAIIMYAGTFQWVGAILVLYGVLIKKWLEEDQLLIWAQHCPFSKDDHLRFHGKYAYWQDPKNEKYITQSLLNLYLVPKISDVKEIPSPRGSIHQFVAEILLGRFIPDVDLLQIRSAWYVSIQNKYDRQYRLSFGLYSDAFPDKITQVKNDQGKVEKMLYFFNVPELDNRWISQNITWGLEVKVRLLMDGGAIQLPSKPLPQEADHDLWAKRRSW